MQKILNNIFKSKKKIIQFVIATLIAPILIMIIGLLVINVLPIIFKTDNPIINISPLVEISGIDVLSLYISILGILVGSYLTIAIFMLQLNDEKEKLNSIKSYYFSEIINSLNMCFLGQF